MKPTVLGALAVTVGLALALSASQAQAKNDRFMKVLERGTLVVGVKM